MKIAFTGTSSTGKTTTALHLRKLGILSSFGLQLLTQDMRKELTKEIGKLTNAEKLDFQDKYFNEKFNMEEDKDNFLVERSFVDLLAHRYFIDPKPSHEEIDRHIKLAKRYSLHFFFPYGVIDYKKDGFRPNEPQAIQISEKIEEIMRINKIQYVSLTDISLENRCNIINAKISEMKRK